MIKTNLGKLTLADFLEIQNIEHQSRLQTNSKNEIKPTIAFLQAIATMLSRRLGKVVSATQAWQVWIACYSMSEWLRTSMQANADISAWYGIDTVELSETELAGYHANLPRIKAQQRLESGNFDHTDPQSVFDLTMLAYDDEPMALQARANAIRAAMDTKQ
jgi:hypothetical protein